MVNEELREQMEQEYITSGVLFKWGYFLFGAFLLVMTLLTKGVEGLIAMSIMIIGSYLLIKKISSKSRSSSKWSRKRLEHDENLPLKKTSHLLSEASDGSKVSRALLEERIRKEILRKVKRERNMNDDEMEELIHHPDELFQEMNEEVLSEFILYSRTRDDLTEKEADRRKNLPESKSYLPRDPRSYRSKLADVINRAKEWGG